MKFINIILLGLLIFISWGCSTKKFERKNGGILYESKEIQADLVPFSTLILPQILEEISGLLIYGDTYLGFNDSGGQPEIYQISKAAEIIKVITLKGIKNVDYESMAMDDTHIFIGDFGNNLGNRKDLRIHYFPKSILENSPQQEVDVKTIEFHYKEQTDFSFQNRKHDFDCEAMYTHNNQLHILTKEWKSFKTHHYTLEIKEGKQTAQLLESYDAGFLITGADAISYDNKNVVALVGYTIDGNITLLMTETPLNQKLVFQTPPIRYSLGSSLTLGQVEGIALITNKDFCISAERFGFEQEKVMENITCFRLE